MARHTIQEHLHDGQIRVTSDERFYLHPETGLWHRGVTGITSLYPAPGLMPWAVNTFNTYADHMAYLDKTSGEGTQVHHVLETAKHVEYSEAYTDIWHYLTAARNFFRMFKPRVIRREFEVYGEVDGIRYAGTVDAEIEIDQGLLDAYLANRAILNKKTNGQDYRSRTYVPAILDYKTSNNLWRKHYLQIAAYHGADSEDFSTHRPLILQLGTREKVGFKLDQANPITDFPVFKHLIHIHKDCYPSDDPPSWLIEGELEFETEEVMA